MAYLTRISDFAKFQEVARCAIVLVNSEMFGDTKDNIPSYAKKCFEKLHVVQRNTTPFEITDEKDETEQTRDFDKLSDVRMEETFGEKNVITAWLAKFTAECTAMANENMLNNPECDINPYYSIEIGKRIIPLLLYFPLYSNVMVPIFGYGSPIATSSAVEAEFNDCKHQLLKNTSRPMRIDKFVTLHLQSFSGRAKLAMAEQTCETTAEWEKREKISHHQQNVTYPDQSTHTTCNEIQDANREYDTANVTQAFTTQTSETLEILNTQKKKIYECDSALSETSGNEYFDLNSEHNWKHK